MRIFPKVVRVCLIALFLLFPCCTKVQVTGDYLDESPAQRDARLQWWNEARFGLFIHWGLYAIPAGEWKGKTHFGEWIRNESEIPVEEYDSFVHQFNPAAFDARLWVRAARAAGMKYIVITSKHHDGFALFDSKHSDFDVMATPFKRDILKELADACAEEGIRLCFYYSIMDWHHPDYLPRRSWETDRPVEGAVYDRYVLYMKDQLRELTSNYGRIGILWFDGQWEPTWAGDRGRDLYNYVRNLQPDIIINNRVNVWDQWSRGFARGSTPVGDYGTPEQEVPSGARPAQYWETCMTMNDHWGYNSHDENWKSARTLIRLLADIASKGGNFLLNVGPTAEGLFPPASLERLEEIGAWMRKNGGSIYGTSAGPFRSLPWGACTQKAIPNGTRLFLHVFDWPDDGQLHLTGLTNTPQSIFLLADSAAKTFPFSRNDELLTIDGPAQAPDSINTVVVLDIPGMPEVIEPPSILAVQPRFTDYVDVSLKSESKDVDIYYTLDGSLPTPSSRKGTGPIRLEQSCTVTARCYRSAKPASASSSALFQKVAPLPAVSTGVTSPGLRFKYYEGDWDTLPDFGRLRVVKGGVVPTVRQDPRLNEERYGFLYEGYIRIPEDGVYTFYLESDDGSRLEIGGTAIVDNDGLHGMIEREGTVALAAGYHPLRVSYFEKNGGDGIAVSIMSRALEKRPVPEEMLVH